MHSDGWYYRAHRPTVERPPRTPSGDLRSRLSSLRPSTSGWAGISSRLPVLPAGAVPASVVPAVAVAAARHGRPAAGQDGQPAAAAEESDAEPAALAGPHERPEAAGPALVARVVRTAQRAAQAAKVSRQVWQLPEPSAEPVARASAQRDQALAGSVWPKAYALEGASERHLTVADAARAWRLD
jgi:hypothetical protein